MLSRAWPAMLKRDETLVTVPSTSESRPVKCNVMGVVGIVEKSKEYCVVCPKISLMKTVTLWSSGLRLSERMLNGDIQLICGMSLKMHVWLEISVVLSQVRLLLTMAQVAVRRGGVVKEVVKLSDCPSVAVTVRIRVWTPGPKSRNRRRNDKEPTRSKSIN